MPSREARLQREVSPDALTRLLFLGFSLASPMSTVKRGPRSFQKLAHIQIYIPVIIFAQGGLGLSAMRVLLPVAFTSGYNPRG